MPSDLKKHGSSSFYQNFIRYRADITIERHSIRMMESAYIYFVVEVKYLLKSNTREL